jgi:hypothetical protein
MKSLWRAKVMYKLKNLVLAVVLLLLPIVHGLNQPQVEASGRQVLVGATTATLANTKLSLAAGYAFFDVGDAAPFADKIGETIEICNTSAMSNCVRGVIGTIGTGETLSATELVTNGDFGASTGWTVGHANITIGSGVCTFASVPTSQQVYRIWNTMTAGRLYKASITISGYSAGQIGIIAYKQGGFPYNLVPASDGTHSIYGTFVSGVANWAIATSGTTTLVADDYSVKHVLTPSATGYWIKSKPGATDGDAWSAKGASFDPNSSGGFTWRILSTNQLGRQVASGTVASADVKLATVDGGSMVAITGVDLSPYAGNDSGGPITIINPRSTSGATMTTNKYLLALYDSAGKVATGYVGAAGGGESLDTEKATGTLTIGKLYKITATEANHFGTGFTVGRYFNAPTALTCDANNKVQEVLAVAATGVNGHSSPNATNRNMARVETGFNPNAVTSYKIFMPY